MMIGEIKVDSDALAESVELDVSDGVDDVEPISIFGMDFCTSAQAAFSDEQAQQMRNIWRRLFGKGGISVGQEPPHCVVDNMAR